MLHAKPKDDGESYEAAGFTEEDFTSELAELSLRNQRKQIRHELTDPYNRIHSIASDGQFVKTVAAIYPDFPIVLLAEGDGDQEVQCDAYFKSMDGHAGEWKFPLRRPNLPFLEVILQSGGAVIVDSTRRGKRFPDALSKTVPIWCAVINRAAFKRSNGELPWSADDLDIHTAAASVGDSERDQIRSKLDNWASELAQSSYSLPHLRKPLRPLHISPSSRLPQDSLEAKQFEHFYPVICLSASRYTSGGSSERHGSFNYVPGSGDDHEGWVPMGFGPQLFWKHKEGILACNRDELYGMMENLAINATKAESEGAQRQNAGEAPQRTWIVDKFIGYQLTSESALKDDDPIKLKLYIGTSWSSHNTGDEPVFAVPADPKKHLQYFSMQIEKIEQSVAQALMQSRPVELVWQEDNTSNERDFGIGILLVALSLHFAEVNDGKGYVGTIPAENISKATVSRRLEWIVSLSKGKLNPSKKILKRVNDYLFSR